MAAITAAVIGVAGTVYASNQAKKQQKKAIEAQERMMHEQQEVLDPYQQYRAGDAEKLQKLVNDPSSIVDTAEYKARMQAVQRQINAQGYAGSGNALAAAAEAGGDVYQQAFNNLAMLSGASTGVQAKAGISSQAMGNVAGAYQQGQENQLSATAGITNNLTNLATTVGQRWNQPTTGGYAPASTVNSGNTAFGYNSYGGGP